MKIIVRFLSENLFACAWSKAHAQLHLVCKQNLALAKRAFPD
jgi:hypothetical protein